MNAQPVPGGQQESQEPSYLFSAGLPKQPDLKSIEALKTNAERFALNGRIFYLHTPHGFGTSKLAERAERLLGVAATKAVGFLSPGHNTCYDKRDVVVE